MVPDAKWNPQQTRQPQPRFRYLAFLAIASFTFSTLTAYAANCTTQGSLQPAVRESLLAAGNTLAGGIAAQNFDLLQSSLLPAVTGDWDGIRSVAQAAKPLVQGGTLTWGDAYLLDASDLKAPADTQFFCTNADSSVTMTISLRSLPPGRYALLIGDYIGAPLAGQIALILGTTDAGPVGSWKLGGIFAVKALSKATTASGTGPTHANWQRRKTPGPPGTATTWPARCCCQSISSLRHIWKN
jgi:hypothetical protein